MLGVTLLLVWYLLSSPAEAQAIHGHRLVRIVRLHKRDGSIVTKIFTGNQAANPPPNFGLPTEAKLVRRSVTRRLVPVPAAVGAGTAEEALLAPIPVSETYVDPAAVSQVAAGVPISGPIYGMPTFPGAASSGVVPAPGAAAPAPPKVEAGTEEVLKPPLDEMINKQDDIEEEEDEEAAGGEEGPPGAAEAEIERLKRGLPPEEAGAPMEPMRAAPARPAVRHGVAFEIQREAARAHVRQVPTTVFHPDRPAPIGLAGSRPQTVWVGLVICSGAFLLR